PPWRRARSGSRRAGSARAFGDRRAATRAAPRATSPAGSTWASRGPGGRSPAGEARRPPLGEGLRPFARIVGGNQDALRQELHRLEGVLVARRAEVDQALRQADGEGGVLRDLLRETRRRLD